VTKPSSFSSNFANLDLSPVICLKQPLSRYHRSFFSCFMTCKTTYHYIVPFDCFGPTWFYLPRSIWDPFHKVLRYILFSSIAIFKHMTFIHTIVARKDWHSIWLSLGKETRELLDFLFKDRIITKSNLLKNTILSQEQLLGLLFLL